MDVCNANIFFKFSLSLPTTSVRPFLLELGSGISSVSLDLIIWQRQVEESIELGQQVLLMPLADVSLCCVRRDQTHSSCWYRQQLKVHYSILLTGKMTFCLSLWQPRNGLLVLSELEGGTQVGDRKVR